LHKEVVDVAEQLVGQSASSPDVSPAGQSEEETHWMYFAVRAMTMMDVGGLRQGLRLGQTPLMWVNGSLRDFINSVFPARAILTDDIKLERLFTARNLERVAGIQVIWTNNTADHLQLEGDDTSVRLFSPCFLLGIT
jgi:hypothetical protein